MVDVFSLIILTCKQEVSVNQKNRFLSFWQKENLSLALNAILNLSNIPKSV